MKEDFIKRLINAEGNKRVTICVDDFAENPRYMTDELLHCEDWSRDYSIMTKMERENKSSSARTLLEYFLLNYGNEEKVIKYLIANYKKAEHTRYENALRYNRVDKWWELVVWDRSEWLVDSEITCKRCELEINDVYELVADDTLIYMVEAFTDGKIKAISYGFGCDGSVSFYDHLSCDSEGICWLEKDEFLKYIGCKEEEYWQDKSLKDIEWLLDEIEAWSEGRAYKYYVEQANTFKVTKECLNDASKSKEYEETEWELIDSCGGFYGDIDYVVDYACDEADLNKEELKETEE